ncbi:hypothetical protein D3C81_1794360 [compost metagenome]
MPVGISDDNDGGVDNGQGFIFKHRLQLNDLKLRHQGEEQKGKDQQQNGEHDFGTARNGFNTGIETINQNKNEQDSDNSQRSAVEVLGRQEITDLSDI